MISKEAAAEASLPLALRIRAVERRLLARRQRVGRVAAEIGPKVRARIGSPVVITAAFGFGVFLHRSTRRSRDQRTWSFVNLLNAAYASSSLAMAISSWVGPATGIQTSGDRPSARS